uniref:Retrovirus-related Pol polyprotein from transposon TNT 1-94 n=1 Tax=Tanacetum cinerariifolium TaxID=118510 RepID=A0A6L2KQ70_TANCI|nr:retrovirus-related Pol polyprotein from transposon TNT 1-94 [Tanacetum cinerariifolium]
MWTELCLAYEGPSNTSDTKIATLRLKFNAFKELEGAKVNGNYTRLKCLLNDLENNEVIISQSKVNATFVNSLRRKWLSMNQTERANNSIKNDSLAALYGKYHYEEGLIDDIYASETRRFTIQASSSKALIFNNYFQDSDSDVEEDNRTSNEFVADLNAEYHERALLANQKRFYKSSMRRIDELTKGKMIKERVTKEKVIRGWQLSHLIRMMNLYPQRMKEQQSSRPSWQLQRISHQLERVMHDLVNGKLTLDQLISEQIPGNIIKALGGKGRKKENNSSKEVLFTKADISTSESTPMITSDSEDNSDNQEPLPPLPKLTGEKPSSALKSLTSLFDVNANMAELTLNTTSKEVKKSSNKISQTYVIKKKTEPKHPAAQNSCSDKNALPSTEQLLLFLMEEVKCIKNQIMISSDTFSSVSQASSLKTSKQKVWYGPCKYCGLKNHLSNDCYLKPKCSTCGSCSHTTKEHTEQTAVRKSLNKLKGQSISKPIPIRNTRMPKAFSECKYYGSNKHHPDDYEFYLGCEICRSIAHKTAYCPKNLRKDRKQRVAIKYSKESGPRVVFGDNSSGDTEGYGLVNCNGITFTKTISHNKYTLVILDEYSRYTWVICLKKKSDTADCIISFIRQMENPNDTKLKQLESDNGIEFRNYNLEAFYDEKDHLGKIDKKADDGFFLSYSSVAKAFKVFNIKRQELEETFHVTFSADDEAILQTSTKGDAINSNEVNSFLDDEFSKPRTLDTVCNANTGYFPYVPAFDRLSIINHVSPEPIITSSPLISSTSEDSSIPNIKGVVPALDEAIHHELDRWSREKHIELANIIGEPLAGITTRSRIRDSEAALAHKCLYVNFLIKIEPKKLIEALEEEEWVLAITEELNQFEKNKVWTLVIKPYGKAIIGLIWVFKNKIDEEGVVTKNKVRLVAKGVSDGCESAFLNGKISEEVYVEQPPGFESSEFPNYVCKLNKALYGLKQAPRAWYQANLKESHLVAVIFFRKITSGECQILGGKLVCWSAKKQTSMAMSSTKAEYVVSVGCCAQVLWIKSQLAEYDVLYDKVPIFCDNTSAINISNNLVLHSRTKHIDIRFHFIRDHILKGDIELHFVPTDLQLANIFTKPLAEPSFPRLVAELGMLNIEKQVAKLYQEPEESLIPSSRETKKKKIISSSQPKSPYKVRVTLPKKQVAKTQHFEVIVAITNATKSLEASKLAEEQGNHPSAAETKKVTVFKYKGHCKQPLSNFSRRECQIPKLQDQIIHDSDESAACEPMPEDDLRSISGSKAADSDDIQGNDVSYSDYTFLNHNASIKCLSIPNHLDHIRKEVSSIHSKLETMESSIIHQVSDGIKSTLLALSDRFTRLKMEFSKTLKSDMGKSVTTLVKYGMKKVRDDLKSQSNSLGKFCLDIQSMQTQLNDIQSLFEPAVIVDDTAEGEKNKKAKDSNPAAT